MLVHPSANFVPNKFDGPDVDVLYLGIGALGTQPARFQNDYWHHTVEATRPGLIIPVHWDDFGRSLDKKPRPMPRVLDKFPKTKDLFDRKSAESGIPVRFQKPFETITPFS
jgi:L-ascorbate metabolism protein UlaG (beta-lactamase superfamily)